METLKIIVFNWRCWFNPDMGGAEVFTHEVLKRLANDGHEVVLFSSRFDGSSEEETSDGVKIIRAGGSYGVYGQAKKWYKDRFSKERYDIVVDEINTRPFSTPKFVDGDEKIVALIHQLAREYWFYEMPFPIGHVGYYFLEERWLKPYFKMPTITVSESTRRDLVNLGFQKIFVVGEGLNFSPLNHLGEKEPFPVIIYLGRLKRAKRPDHAVKAFKIVKQRSPEAELWIFGTGYFREKLEKIMSEGVKFYGDLSNDRRREMISRSWVLVNPSIREGFGLNVIEANALGVPTVAYDVPGLRDSVVSGETGFLVEPGNINAMGEAVFDIISDDSLRERLSKNSLEYSKSFDWDNVADKFIKAAKNI